MAVRKLGVLGGTFDPPHHGHLIVASDALEVLGLDRILLVPAAEPPHKPGSVFASGGQRLAMLQSAVAGDDRFVVEEMELERRGPSYTVDTLRALRAREPDAELIFLLGIDQFRAFGRWRQPDQVAVLARLGVLSRAGEVPDLSGPWGAVGVPVTRVDISSTEIRRRVAGGLQVRYHVPEAVRRIIEREGLYRRNTE